jgi:hypothetical protein
MSTWLQRKIEAEAPDRLRRAQLRGMGLNEPTKATRRKRAQQVYDAAVTSHLEDMPPF